jgi:hypothetical protein
MADDPVLFSIKKSSLYLTEGVNYTIIVLLMIIIINKEKHHAQW